MISIERVETPQYEFHWWSYNNYIVEAWPWIKCRKRHGTSSSADYVNISLPDLSPDIPRTRRQVTLPLFLQQCTPTKTKHIGIHHLLLILFQCWCYWSNLLVYTLINIGLAVTSGNLMTVRPSIPLTLPTMLDGAKGSVGRLVVHRPPLAVLPVQDGWCER
jgi:hypothetical protein